MSRAPRFSSPSFAPLLAASRRALPGLALSCLGAALAAGCLDPDVSQGPEDGDGPLTLVAVVGSETSALPPKPALAELATATSATRQRFMDAALGADVSQVFGSVVAYALAPPACPVIERRGGTLYSTPDCTDAAGVHWSGRLVAHTWDDDRPMTITLERWRADAPGNARDVAYEGTITVHPDGRFQANLVTARDGFVSRTFATWRSDAGKVIADADSWVIVQDHGIAQIGGAWRLPRGERPTGALYLDGADQLVLDLEAEETADLLCAPIFVDGAAHAKRCDLPELAEALAAFSLF
ncbi:MAG: hypothetical protein K8M05_16840 [Deltaproteobacteria bacterium]|nr:hypothetical protein [Kofleriaceae bacterium]